MTATDGDYCAECQDELAKDEIHGERQAERNEIESDTPRTDDQSVMYHNDYTGARIEYVSAKFARQLERELAQVIFERDELKAGFDKDGNNAAESCCVRIKKQLAKERDDALTALAMLGDKHERELATVTAERNRLANALKNLRSCIKETRGLDAHRALVEADAALAAVKNSSNNQNHPPKVG